MMFYEAFLYAHLLFWILNHCHLILTFDSSLQRKGPFRSLSPILSSPLLTAVSTKLWQTGSCVQTKSWVGGSDGLVAVSQQCRDNKWQLKCNNQEQIATYSVNHWQNCRYQWCSKDCGQQDCWSSTVGTPGQQQLWRSRWFPQKHFFSDPQRDPIFALQTFTKISFMHPAVSCLRPIFLQQVLVEDAFKSPNTICSGTHLLIVARDTPTGPKMLYAKRVVESKLKG